MNMYKLNDKQNALAYVIYMIVGSYFTKTKCISRYMERKLYLYYKEIGVNTQYIIEENCIKFAEKVLRKKLPVEIWEEEVKVQFPTVLDENQYVRFVGNSWTLEISYILINIRRPELHFEFSNNVVKSNPNIDTKAA